MPIVLVRAFALAHMTVIISFGLSVCLFWIAYLFANITDRIKAALNYTITAFRYEQIKHT